VHDALAGTNADYTSAGRDINVSHYSTTSKYEIRRGFFVFDTSSIPDNASIQSASLKVYVSGKANGDNDGEDFFVAVPTTQASTVSLSLEDYDQAGAVSNPQELSGRVDLGIIVTGVYNAWSLNAAGLSAIDKGGMTKIGLREGHDVLNHTIAAGKTNKIAVKFSEQTGTAQDLYLEITYTAP